jgi:hypothetical protein
MDAPPQPAQPCAVRRRQFSLRSLFALTFFTATLLTISYLCRGSYFFGAIASPWVIITLAPIVGGVACHHWQLVATHMLGNSSLLLYIISLALPAINLGQDIAFGAIAAYLAFAGIFMFESWWTEPSLFSPSWEVRTWYPIAGTMGTLANLTFILAYISFLFLRRRKKAIAFARRSALISVALASLSILPLSLSGQLEVTYPGYGLWVASLAALALGTSPSRRLAHPIYSRLAEQPRGELQWPSSPAK